MGTIKNSSNSISVTWKNVTYPQHGKYNNESGNGIFIVLFMSEDYGIVVESDNKNQAVGHCNNSWAMCDFIPIFNYSTTFTS